MLSVTKRILIVVLLLASLCSFGQTRKRHFRQREVGLFGGAAYYIGDLNPRGHFLFSRPGVGAFYRLAMGYRTAFRFGFNYGLVTASDSRSKEADQLERNLSFRSNIYDVHALGEFNFIDYRIGNDKHYFTMFIFAGLGGFYFNPQSTINGSVVNLNERKTEGRKYSKIQVNVPFGVGIKWNVTDLIGLGFEWGPRKTYTDYIDDVSGTYPSAVNVFAGSGAPGTMRGNPRTKDWYFFYGFTAQMRLPKKNQECHGMGIN